jgi:hypothetical protein
MGTRGPKSRNDLAFATTGSTKRAEPPESLTDEAKTEWRRIVNELPAGHFNESQLPMLKQYVRHQVEASHISRMIQIVTDDEEIDLQHYDRLLKMQERESRIMASLAVRLNFAKARRKESGRARAGMAKPWE